MHKYPMIVLAALAIAAMLVTPHALADDDPRVLLRTSEGDILLQLDRERAPSTVENFLAYVESGHYDGTIFHRVIRDFMIQGGGYDGNFNTRRTREPVRNEADNGLRNVRGTIAMARTSDPHSATAQFYINTVDNPSLDHRGRTRAGWGYTVFGEVIEGMDTVDRIRNIRTTRGGPFPGDVPSTMVVIESAERVAPAAAAD